jgi:hypothetical protein
VGLLTSATPSRRGRVAGSATVCSGCGGHVSGGEEKRAYARGLAVCVGLSVGSGSIALFARHRALCGGVNLRSVRARYTDTGSLAAEVGAACSG